ncbi:MAG TPA: glutathione S-transferase family protein [Polyangiaceae bacterium]
MSARVLHQFPISHFCEKTRWHLDAKGLAYEVKDLFPGFHAVVNRRLVGRPTVPLLMDGDRAIGDSTAIALYLEEKYPGPSLIPTDPGLRSRVLELEEYFDGTFGPEVRRWIYGQALLTSGLVPKLFFGSGYSPALKTVGRALGFVLSTTIRRMYRINAASVAKSSDRIAAAADRLEELVGGDPRRHLVGEAFTLADLTAASLLGPLVGPPQSPWADLPDAPPAVVARREEMRSRVAGQWVMERYARDRQGLSERASS